MAPGRNLSQIFKIMIKFVATVALSTIFAGTANSLSSEIWAPKGNEDSTQQKDRATKENATFAPPRQQVEKDYPVSLNRD